MMQSFRKVLDALARSSRDRVADRSHNFLAANRNRESNGKSAYDFHDDKDGAWTSYINNKQRIKARIEAGDALSPLQKALAEQFKKDDPDYIYGTAPIAPSDTLEHLSR